MDAADATQCEELLDPVLAVGDNVLWTEPPADWSTSRSSEKSDLAYEVADIVEHASSRLKRYLDVGAFIESLHLDSRQRSRLIRCRRLLAVFWLVKLLPGNGGFTRNPAGSTEDQAQHVLSLLDSF